MKRICVIVAALFFAVTAVPAAAVDYHAGTRLEPFVRAAAKIRTMRDGRVSAVFWDLAGLTDAQIKGLASLGFNELVVDGHHFATGSLGMEFVIQRVIAAQRAGITSFKFVRGSPDWAAARRNDAVRRINQMTDRILELKKELRLRNEMAADQIVKGVLINVESYADPSWDYDFTVYVDLHRELESLTLRKGLTYESFEAFWIGQTRHESGRVMTGFKMDSPRTVYIMSYRKDSYEAFKIADYFAVRGPHLAGFDLVTGSQTGFRDDPAAMSEAVSDYVELSSSPGRPGFKGIFVNAAHARDIIAFARAASRTRGPSND